MTVTAVSEITKGTELALYNPAEFPTLPVLIGGVAGYLIGRNITWLAIGAIIGYLVSRRQ